MRGLFVSALLAAALLASGPASAQRPARADPLYTQMRNGALSTGASAVGVTPRPGETRVYGVVLDIDISGRTATIIAFASGDASLYLSSGGGQIGGIGVPAVAAAARSLVGAVTPAHLAAATRVTACPRPERGQATFYFLTTDGVRMVTRPTAALETATDSYSALFAAGQAVITGFREIDDARARRR